MHPTPLLAAFVLGLATLVSAAPRPQIIINPINVKIELYADANYKGDSIKVEPARSSCNDVGSKMNDRITSFKVLYGCCNFYRNGGCNDLLFQADRREHSNIGSTNSDQISSYKCNLTCGTI
ncbi:hypothetical protein BZA05DRAFT_411481 [Tricharina praecox]|uniref:uncharacterized protein n=1 Tax=Tricharina praecox TaxID=43433 RepID=UPI00221E9FE7|nr:uncharacterized protein BZA05DRAFT_411481 [Tricharina praecox]KAI5842803.1 hypothetical protein BZA05DRAFT_411481 [Tricharina praecox]